MKKYFYLALALLFGVFAGLYAIVSATVNMLEGLVSIIAWVLIVIVAYFGIRLWINK